MAIEQVNFHDPAEPLSPRIMGTEAEVLTSLPDFVRLPDRAFAAAGLYAACRTGRVWLSNGACFYDDCRGDGRGLHELASAEALGPLAAEIATRGALRAYQEVCANLPPHLRKGQSYYSAGSYAPRPTESSSGTGGTHKSTHFERAFHLNAETLKDCGPWQHTRLGVVQTFLATSLWAGSGIVTPDGFRFMQKDGSSKNSATLIRIQTSDDTTDLHFPGERQLMRLERYVGDANRLLGGYVAKAAFSLVLRMCETPLALSDETQKALLGARLAQTPAYELQVANRDLSLTKRFECIDGVWRTVRQIQKIYAAAAAEFVSRAQVPPDEEAAVALWHQMNDIMDGVVLWPKPGHEVELGHAPQVMHWALRLRQLLHRTEGDISQIKVDTPVAPTNDQEAAGADAEGKRRLMINDLSLMLDLVHPTDVLAKAAAQVGAQLGFTERYDRTSGQPDQTDVGIRARTPPPDTRAASRGRIITELGERGALGDITGVSWKGIAIGDEPYAIRARNANKSLAPRPYIP